MEKKIIVFKLSALFVLSIVLLSSNLFSQSANFAWAKSFGSSTYDEGWSIANDASGNVYTTGRFSSIVDFDPSPSTFTLAAVGQQDVFVTKFDPNGNFVWAKSLGGNADDRGYSIHIDNSGNILITGIFVGLVDFDPSPSTFTLNSFGGTQEDAFILKLNSSGNFIWAKQIGGNTADYGESITTDLAGNIYLSGRFSGTADFDPSVNSFTISTLPTSTDGFVMKLDGSGNFIWAKQFAGQSSSTSSCNEVRIDGAGNIYTTGYFYNTVDFDPSISNYTLSALGNNEVFVSKLDPSGNFIWAKQIGGLSNDESNSITIDQSNNPIITGFFTGTADFDPSAGTNTITSIGAQDIFVTKLNSSGNLVWVKTFGGTSPDRGFSITSDQMNNIYSIGHFQATVDFDPGVGVVNFTSPAGDNDIYISKLDPSGNYLWAKQLGGNFDDTGWGISLDQNGNVYTTGYFNGTADFDPSPSTFTLTSQGIQDAFIHKLSCAAPNLTITSTSNTICVGETVTLTVSGASSYTWNTTSTLTSIPVSPTITTSYSATGIDTHGCSNSSSFSQVVSPCTGMNELSNSTTIEVYPNPSVGQLTIKLSSTHFKAKFSLYNISGQEIFNTNIMDEFTILDLSAYSKGIYLYKIIENDSTINNGKLILE